MSWEDQGRQEHGWFGNGTAPPKDSADADRSDVEQRQPDEADSAEAAGARAYAWAKAHGPVLFGLPRSGAALDRFADEVMRRERARPGSAARALDRWAAQGKFGEQARAVRDGLLVLASNDAGERSPGGSPLLRLAAGEVPEEEDRRVDPEGRELTLDEETRQELYSASRRELARIDPKNPILTRETVRAPGYVPTQAEVEEVARAVERARASGPTPDGPVNTFSDPGRPTPRDPVSTSLPGRTPDQPRPPVSGAADLPGLENAGRRVTLPNASKAVVDFRKLTDYALNPDHPKGRDKAQVFASALGFAQENAAELAAQIKTGVQTAPAVPGPVDEHGGRFTVDVPVVGPKGSGVVRTGWIIDPESGTPRLVTAFVR